MNLTPVMKVEKHLKTKKLKSAFNLKERWEICAFKIIVATQPFFFLFASLLISPFLRYRDAAPNELVLRVQPGNYSATSADQNSFFDYAFNLLYS